jgi:23S rRNA (cytosine1962-C5)-methyltransferase
MRIAAINSKLRIKILEHLFQDVDHPYLINFPQSLYLKGLLAQKD